jgi:aminoglycoside/choline kinase family phosphotransferase
VLSLRDFHAENLIWQPDHGNLRVGLLDFQDAFITHQALRLASFLRDDALARRDVDPALLDLTSPNTRWRRLGADFKRAFHVMAVQRNLTAFRAYRDLQERDGKRPDTYPSPHGFWAHYRPTLRPPDLIDLGRLVSAGV